MIFRIMMCVSFAATVSCAVAAPPKKEAKLAQIQFALFHFKDDRVRVAVNGKTVFDRAVNVTSESGRYGLAAVAQIKMPDCADIVVTTKRQRLAKRVCRTANTKSIVIDAGPPLTILAKDEFQGDD
jgi:hypothetical protein